MVCFQDPGFQAGKDRLRQMGNSVVSPQMPSCLPGWNFQVAAQAARAPVGLCRQRCLNLQDKAPERREHTGDGRGGTAEGWSAHSCEESTSVRKGPPETAGISTAQGWDQCLLLLTRLETPHVTGHWAHNHKVLFSHLGVAAGG